MKNYAVVSFLRDFLRALRYPQRELSGRGPGGIILLPRGDDTPFTLSCKLEQYRSGGESFTAAFTSAMAR